MVSGQRSNTAGSETCSPVSGLTSGGKSGPPIGPPADGALIVAAGVSVALSAMAVGRAVVAGVALGDGMDVWVGGTGTIVIGRGVAVAAASVGAEVWS